jgi:hypothetical protein
MGSVPAFFGFTSTAIILASGTSSEISSIRFGISATLRMLTPVMLPPGRARLSTSPLSTGSLPVVKMIGIVSVAVFAARADAAPPVATPDYGADGRKLVDVAGALAAGQVDQGRAAHPGEAAARSR